MSECGLKALGRDLHKLRRSAPRWACRLHDLVVDRLPAGYEAIPDAAQSTDDACKALADARAKRDSMQSS